MQFLTNFPAFFGHFFFIKKSNFRTVLEKIRPIDQKLRYQVDKLVAIAEKGTVDQNDPLRYRLFHKIPSICQCKGRHT